MTDSDESFLDRIFSPKRSQPMTDDVERVARAINAAAGLPEKEAESGCWDEHARAAIAVLQGEGWQKVPEGSVVVPSDCVDYDKAIAWQLTRITEDLLSAAPTAEKP